MRSAIHAGIAKFGRLDAVVHSATGLSTRQLRADISELSKLDALVGVDLRGAFILAETAAPHLAENKNLNPHFLTIAPPITALHVPYWFHRPLRAQALTKLGVSSVTRGLADEYKGRIAANALWPKIAVTTSMPDSENKNPQFCRKPQILADAACLVLQKPCSFSGNFLLDEDVLRESGVHDFQSYSVQPGHELRPSVFLDSYLRFEEKEAERKKTASSNEVGKIFGEIEKAISPDIISKVGAVYVFSLSGREPGDWLVDLKNGTGTVKKGAVLTDGGEEPDVVMSMDSDNFLKLIAGTLKPRSAFMMGKLKIKGDTVKALKLDAILSQVGGSKK